jgi:elongation factor P
MLGHTDLRKDTLIQLDGVPYRVTDYSHAAMGRGGAVARVKLKNLLTGSVIEKSFRTSDKIEPAEISRQPMQYLYAEGGNLAFMNQSTFDQESVSQDVLGDQAKYMAEGNVVTLLYFKGKVIGLEMPHNVWLRVTKAEIGLKGDSATGSLKPVTVETGMIVSVPLFINQGDVIKVDTRSGAYIERQK